MADRTGPSPSTSLRAGWAPVGSAAHRVTFGSMGEEVGLGCSPPLAGQLASWSPPRTKTSADPSGEKVSWVSSWPSSSVNWVTCRGVKSGPSATKMLRTPRTMRTQAIRSVVRALTRPSTKGKAVACSTVKPGAAARAGVGRVAVPRPAASRASPAAAAQNVRFIIASPVFGASLWDEGGGGKARRAP